MNRRDKAAFSFVIILTVSGLFGLWFIFHHFRSQAPRPDQLHVIEDTDNGSNIVTMPGNQIPWDDPENLYLADKCFSKINYDQQQKILVCEENCGPVIPCTLKMLTRTIADAIPADLAEAAEIIPEAQAVHAILGEARGEGYAGMYAVAHAIRNRGHLRGVYGLQADISDVAGKTYQVASKAWQDSESGPDTTFGENHWFSGFKVPYWAKGKRPTAVIGGHRFYKLK